MAIIGFSLTKILLERKEAPIKKVEVKSKLHIPSMEKQDMKLIEGKDTLRFNFEYDIEYAPKLANISFKGFVLFASDPKQSEEILREWNKNQRIDKDVQLQLYNYIFNKCNIKALQLEDDFNLPPHLQLPTIKIEDKK